MTMTRKDYIKFAKMLKDAQRFLAFLRQADYQGTLAAKQMLQDIEKDLVNIFKADNPNFDADRLVEEMRQLREVNTLRVPYTIKYLPPILKEVPNISTHTLSK